MEHNVLSTTPHCNLLVIRSSDIARAVTFYEAIGLSFAKHCHGSGPEHYTTAIDSLIFEIYPARTPTETTVATRIGFTVDSINSVVKKLTDLNATIQKQPSHSEYGQRAIVLDYDGHTVELMSSTKKCELNT